MVRKIGLLFGILLVASFPARTQDKVEVFGGYSYMRFRSSPSANLNGWELSGQYKFTDWLGGVADLDGHYGSVGGVGTSVHSYLFGRRSLFLLAFRRLRTYFLAVRISVRQDSGILRFRWPSGQVSIRN